MRQPSTSPNWWPAKRNSGASVNRLLTHACIRSTGQYIDSTLYVGFRKATLIGTTLISTGNRHLFRWMSRCKFRQALSPPSPTRASWCSTSLLRPGFAGLMKQLLLEDLIVFTYIYIYISFTQPSCWSKSLFLLTRQIIFAILDVLFADSA